MTVSSARANDTERDKKMQKRMMVNLFRGAYRSFMPAWFVPDVLMQEGEPEKQQESVEGQQAPKGSKNNSKKEHRT